MQIEPTLFRLRYECWIQYGCKPLDKICYTIGKINDKRVRYNFVPQHGYVCPSIRLGNCLKNMCILAK